MTVPRFNAEVALYRSSTCYGGSAASSLGCGLGIELAQFTRLAARRGLGLQLDCGGSCPVGEVLCSCSRNCRCCSGGCYEDLHGWCYCDSGGAGTPGLAGPLASSVGQTVA